MINILLLAMQKVHVLVGPILLLGTRKASLHVSGTTGHLSDSKLTLLLDFALPGSFACR